MKKSQIFAVGFSIVCLIVAMFFLYRIFLKPSGIDIDKKKYPITGIDVSKHTGKINFNFIKEKKIDFIYIKSTEGGDYIDPKFELNYSEIIKRNIPVGAYHFFNFKVSGKKQAQNFLKAIKSKNFELPLALDIEEWGNASCIKEEVIQEINSFISEFEKSTNHQLMFYSNESGYKKYIQGKFKNKDIWICSFNNPPNINNKWTFWQHSHKGKLKGAEGWIDINTFNGDKEEWYAYLKKNKNLNQK